MSAGAEYLFFGVGVVDFGVGVFSFWCRGGGFWCRGGGWGKKSRCRLCPPPQHSRRVNTAPVPHLVSGWWVLVSGWWILVSGCLVFGVGVVGFGVGVVGFGVGGWGKKSRCRLCPSPQHSR